MGALFVPNEANVRVDGGYSRHRSIRTETQNTHPLLVGWVFVRSEPKALAAGTAG